MRICFSALTRVNNPEKRQAVWKELATVIEAHSEEQFDELFGKALEKWAADADTKGIWRLHSTGVLPQKDGDCAVLSECVPHQRLTCFWKVSTSS